MSCPSGGSTPAHAGNTDHEYYISADDSVYPRPRGEYSDILFLAGLAGGLPPPTRGILLRLAFIRHQWRSTPAHAGNTCRYCGSSNPKEVYPRPRGEYLIVRRAGSASMGLPPPTRGIHEDAE